MIRWLMISFLFFTALNLCAQSDADSTSYEPHFSSYKIYLKKPAQEIREILYYKDCQPIKGTISDDQKTVIMDGYIPRNKVYLQVIYTDGTEEEIIRSPCFIDPVI